MITQGQILITNCKNGVLYDAEEKALVACGDVMGVEERALVIKD